MPTGEVTGFQWLSIDSQKANLGIDVRIENRSGLSIPISGVSYFVESKGKRPLHGSLTDLRTVKGHDSVALNAPVSIAFGNIIDLCQSIEPGSTMPCKIRLEIILKLPIIGRLIVPVERHLQFTMPYVPSVRLKEITVNNASNEEVNFSVGIEVENMNEFGARIHALELGLCVLGKRLRVVQVLGAVDVKGKRMSVVSFSVILKPECVVFGLWGFSVILKPECVVFGLWGFTSLI